MLEPAEVLSAWMGGLMLEPSTCPENRDHDSLNQSIPIRRGHFSGTGSQGSSVLCGISRSVSDSLSLMNCRAVLGTSLSTTMIWSLFPKSCDNSTKYSYTALRRSGSRPSLPRCSLNPSTMRKPGKLETQLNCGYVVCQ